MANIAEANRKYDLKKPPGHKVPVPRWTLKFPRDITHTYTLYIGVQCQSSTASTTAREVEQTIQNLLDNDTDGNKPEALDTFRVTEGFDIVGCRVWVAYWTSPDPFNATLKTLDLRRIWRDIPSEEHGQAIGLWLEHFTTPLERLETNYARLEHKPGLAQISGCEQPSHDLTGYWGAGRDRIPASGEDRFDYAGDGAVESTGGKVPKGVGEWVRGKNYGNMCHIRSGQYWATCPPAERTAYESDLEPALMEGMRYLWTNASETGTLGLRFLQNLNPQNDGWEPILETCGAGFHRNWADLEKWSSRHPSHLKIFNGAMRHAKAFGEGRKFMTWHEVSILKEGEARFEYVNCASETGVMRWVPGLRVEGL